MLDDARRALETGHELSDLRRGVLVERVACLCRFQKETLEDLGERAGPEEQQSLEPFVRTCASRCQCLREMKGCCEHCTPTSPCAEMWGEWLSRFPACPQGGPESEGSE
jgi:hypothetical protein